MNEPSIRIEGVELTIGQAMTARVAISAFLQRMEDDGLGDDENGRSMAAAYIARASEILHLMQKGPGKRDNSAAVLQWGEDSVWTDGDESDMAKARAQGFETRTLYRQP